MFSRVLLASILIFSIFLFTGCAGKSNDQQKEAVNAASATAEQAPQDPCEVIINEAVAEARATMRIVMKSCQDNNIEATPVWSLNYKGAVHVRIIDKNGAQIKETYVNP